MSRWVFEADGDAPEGDFTFRANLLDVERRPHGHDDDHHRDAQGGEAEGKGNGARDRT